MLSKAVSLFETHAFEWSIVVTSDNSITIQTFKIPVLMMEENFTLLKITLIKNKMDYFKIGVLMAVFL